MHDFVKHFDAKSKKAQKLLNNVPLVRLERTLTEVQRILNQLRWRVSHWFKNR